MKPRWKALSGFLLATVLTAPAWGANTATALPGTLNYIEGQANVGDQKLNTKSIGSVELQPGQPLSTETGKVEILLTPGSFLRVGDHSTVTMVSSSLTNTQAELTKGQATVEVAEIHRYNLLRISENGTTTRLLKDGLYAFDADRGQVRVLKGQAFVQDGDQTVKVKGGHELNLNQTGKLKAQKFDKKAFEDSDLYRFSDLRSEYLAEANVDAARKYYAGGSGWYGPGWYWDAPFWAYTWIPGDGMFYSPFGWGFYSPWYVYNSSFLWGGYGFGGYGFGSFGYGYRPFHPGRWGQGRGSYAADGQHGFGTMGVGFGHGGEGGFHGGGFGGGHR